MATVRQREGTTRSLGNSQDYPSSERRSPSSARTDVPPHPTLWQDSHQDVSHGADLESSRSHLGTEGGQVRLLVWTLGRHSLPSQPRRWDMILE